MSLITKEISFSVSRRTANEILFYTDLSFFVQRLEMEQQHKGGVGVWSGVVKGMHLSHHAPMHAASSRLALLPQPYAERADVTPSQFALLTSLASSANCQRVSVTLES